MELLDQSNKINSLNYDERQSAFVEFLKNVRPAERDDSVFNLHCHTFFSYNGYGMSPQGLVALARSEGWYALGTVDFDVLDGVDETLESADLAGVRAVAGMETRTFVPEFADDEINSPGEPGVCYHVGLGFCSRQVPPKAGRVLAQMRAGAEQRNRAMFERIMPALAPLTLDYDRDVQSLTPAGNATERHILVALDAAARELYPDRCDLLAFWTAKLGLSPEKVEAGIGLEPGPSDLVRSRLMKRGGVGYVQPGPDTFPMFADVAQAIIAAGAIPTLAWLDGSTSGEQRLPEMLELMVARGVGAFNIIPDRNWNFADAALRKTRVAALYEAVELAREFSLPVVVGTELNKPGQRILDDFNAEPLVPLHDEFTRGTDFCYGHTVMERAWGIGYQSDWAARYLGSRQERNAFYIEAGRLIPPGAETLARLRAVSVPELPDRVLGVLAQL